MKRLGKLRAALAVCLAAVVAFALLPAEVRAEEEMEVVVDEPMLLVLEPEQVIDAGPEADLSLQLDVLAEQQPEDGALALDVNRLCERFGHEGAQLQVSAAQWIGDYERCRTVDGSILVPAKSRYLLVEFQDDPEAKKNVLWAGVIGSGSAPQAALRAEAQTAQEGDEDLVLDLSEVIAAYGSEVGVEVAYEGKVYSIVMPDENGVVSVKIGGSVGRERRYVSILRTTGSDPSGKCIWAGVFNSTQAPQRYAIRLEGDPEPDPTALKWSLNIVRVEPQAIELAFTGDADRSAAWNQAEVQIAFLDGEKHALGSVRETTEVFASGCSAVVPEGTAEVVAKLMLGDTEMFAARAEYVAPTPSPEPVPVLRLDEESVERRDGRTAFSGAVTLDGRGAEGLSWTLYVNDQPCEATWSRNGDVCAFQVEYYEADVGSLSISARAEGTGLRTDVATLEVTAPVVYVQISGWSGDYDGEFHEAAAIAGEGVAYSHAVCGAVGELPQEEDWQEGLPGAEDAGKLTAYVRAEKEGCRVVYLDADGEALDADNGGVVVTIEIQPAKLTLSVRAEQIDEAVYNGKEQTIGMRLTAEIAEDPAGKFDVSAVTDDERWVSECSVTAREAGSYPVQMEQDRFDYIKEIDPNYEVTVEWLSGEAVILPKPVTLVSASAVALYGEQSGPLTVDEAVQGKENLGEEGVDYYSNDVLAIGKQSGVGVSRNEIRLSDEFQRNMNNYALDCREGVLVVFPQSISRDDPEWARMKDEIDPMEYADMERDELPGFYCGMRVELDSVEELYDGREKQPTVYFRRQGQQLKLLQGEDYEVRFLRDGAETDDLTSAGTIDVEITGKGNYVGTVTQTFEIRPMTVGDVAVQMDGWVYDGAAADSEGHRPRAEGALRFVYRDEAGNEIDPPSDAGSYTVQAVWEGSENCLAAQSELCGFVISPAKVMVRVQNGVVTDIEDATGLFSGEMLVDRDGALVCENDNFIVDLRQEEHAVRLESWEYDGTAAGAGAHQPEADGAEKILYLNEAGAEIDPPSEAGSYAVRAIWSAKDGGQTAEQAFEIRPRIVTVRAENAEKVWGDEDPALTAEVEGLLDGDSVEYSLERAAGEDAGSYAIEPSGEERQGSYLLIFERGELEILPGSIEDAVVEWFDDRPTISTPDGGELAENTDYAIRIEEVQPGRADVVVEGMGNYAGTLRVTCGAGPLQAEMTLTDRQGAPLEELDVNRDGCVSFSGELSLNAPVQASRLSILVNGEKADAALEDRGEGKWAFVVESHAIAGSDAEEIEIAAAVNGTARCAQTAPLRWREDARVWLFASVGLSVAAVLCLLGCIGLSRKLKRERYKLLDKVSRQSNRTLREERN